MSLGVGRGARRIVAAAGARCEDDEDRVAGSSTLCANVSDGHGVEMRDPLFGLGSTRCRLRSQSVGGLRRFVVIAAPEVARDVTSSRRGRVAALTGLADEGHSAQVIAFCLTPRVRERESEMERPGSYSITGVVLVSSFAQVTSRSRLRCGGVGAGSCDSNRLCFAAACCAQTFLK